MVWHHRRNSLKAYWKQQQGYGKAEALLEEKWPERYNALGHLSWSGRLYGTGWTRALAGRAGRIYHGTWGQAPFQLLYEHDAPFLAMLPLMPEWWFAIGTLFTLVLLGFAWTPLLLALPLLVVALAAPIAQAWVSTRDLPYPAGIARFERVRLRFVTAGLHVAQPIARLRGRLAHGLTPWRTRGSSGYALPVASTVKVWSNEWAAPETWIGGVERSLRESGAVVRSGGSADRWDLELRGGLAASARLLHTAEDHSTGQLAHFRVWPPGRVSVVCFALSIASLGAMACWNHQWFVGSLMGAAGLALWAWIVMSASCCSRRSQRFHCRPGTTKSNDEGHDRASLGARGKRRPSSPGSSAVELVGLSPGRVPAPSRLDATRHSLDFFHRPGIARSMAGQDHHRQRHR